MDHHLSGKCKFCDLEFEHHYDNHIFNTSNAIEECKYVNKVVNHYLENHKDKYVFTTSDRIGVLSRKVIKAILGDILGIIILPFSFIVSVLFKIFEWLNDRIGLFD